MSIVTQVVYTPTNRGCVRVWLVRYSKMMLLYEWRP